ncbi:MAG: hypothetical protein AAGA68_10445 [Pseudomonadota bacterium]
MNEIFGSWLSLTLAATAFTTTREYLELRVDVRSTSESAGRSRRLLSTASTLLFAAAGMAIVGPDALGDWSVWILVFAAAFSGGCYWLQRELKSRASNGLSVATVQSVRRLGVFLPVLVFVFLMDDGFRLEQIWIPIVLTLPILAVAWSGKRQGAPKGHRWLSFFSLLGAVFVGGALKILDTLMMDLRIEPISFMIATNTVAAVLGISVLLAPATSRGFAAAPPKPSIKQTAQAIAIGLFNFLGFGCYLQALTVGPPAVIVPMVGLSGALIVAIDWSMPAKPDQPPQRKKALALLLMTTAALALVLATTVAEG